MRICESSGAAWRPFACRFGPASHGQLDDVNQIIQNLPPRNPNSPGAQQLHLSPDVKLQELDPSGNPAAACGQVSDILFSPEGRRMEHVVYAPVPNLQHIMLTPEDSPTCSTCIPSCSPAPRSRTTKSTIWGKEKVDEIGCYNFSIKPKKMVQGKRYFEGQIWVDDRDLQIVKTYGKGVGYYQEGRRQQFPKFETYRQQIDGKYWFPNRRRADRRAYHPHRGKNFRAHRQGACAGQPAG